MTKKQNSKENRQVFLKDYYEKNKDRINERNRKYREDNLELCRAQDRAKYLRNKDKMINATRIRRLSEPERELLYGAKNRSLRFNLPFNLELSDINIPETCPLLEIQLCRGKGSVQAASPSLDRIIPDKGYVKGNVWVISHRANMLKNASSLEELELIVKNLKERKKND
jgi:hypothetical protein